MRDLAARLIAAESSRPGTDSLAPAAFRACGRLRVPFAAVLGAAGFRAVLARALTVASVSVPWLRAGTIAEDGSLTGWDGPEAPRGEAHAEGGALLFAELLALLVSFVGANLTLRLVQEVWPEHQYDPIFLEVALERSPFEALVIDSMRQLELKDTAERLNTQLQVEIAARQQAARELAEKARLLDLSNDAIIVRSFDDQITSWNQGAEKLFGWSAAEAIGQNLDRLLQTEFAQPREAIAAQFRQQGWFHGEVVQRAREGRRIPLLCRWVVDPETESILASYTDITERHALETVLSDRAADLARADRSKDEFLAMLAHELRSPLAPLQQAAEILQSHDASVDERSLAQQIIGRQIENMGRMVNDLLDVSRIAAGDFELRKEPVALMAIVTATASLARTGCAARHQHLTVSLPEFPVYLQADATRLEQVFNNLVANASKYSGSGSHISLSAERVGGLGPPQVEVRVSDDGIGIDPALLPRVFDLFVQATRSLDRDQGGLGIGLTLVSRLVNLHGGSVEAHSAGLGLGSEFVVRLPILAEAPPPVVPAPIGPAEREAARRILIVDDNTDSAHSLAMLQSRRGHQTRVAFTGPTAIEVAAEFLPEVVLLDLGLPGMDGYAVARLLRRNPALAGVLLIAMTGYASPEDRLAAMEAGFDEHLVKPVDMAAVRSLLQLPRRRAESSQPGALITAARLL